MDGENNGKPWGPEGTPIFGNTQISIGKPRRWKPQRKLARKMTRKGFGDAVKMMMKQSGKESFNSHVPHSVLSDLLKKRWKQKGPSFLNFKTGIRSMLIHKPQNLTLNDMPQISLLVFLEFVVLLPGTFFPGCVFSQYLPRYGGKHSQKPHVGTRSIELHRLLGPKLDWWFRGKSQWAEEKRLHCYM